MYPVLRAFLADVVPNHGGQLAKCAALLSTHVCFVLFCIVSYCFVLVPFVLFDYVRRQSLRSDSQSFFDVNFEHAVECFRALVLHGVSLLSFPAKLQVVSYNCLAAVLDLFIKTRNGGVCPDDLEAAVATYLHHRLSAYGAAAFSPKAHYSLHLPDQLREERKHKELKKWANQSHSVTNRSSAWERSLMEEVVLQQARRAHAS